MEENRVREYLDSERFITWASYSILKEVSEIITTIEMTCLTGFGKMGRCLPFILHSIACANKVNTSG